MVLAINLLALFTRQSELMSCSAARCKAGIGKAPKVLLRVCNKCVGRKNYDPCPVLKSKLEKRISPEAQQALVQVESGSCIGPCSDGPNIELLIKDKHGMPKKVVVDQMERREKTYRCFLSVRDGEAAGRVCDIAWLLATGEIDPAGKKPKHMQQQGRSETESPEQRAARFARYEQELAESRAYRNKREADAGAQEWRTACR